MRDSRRDASGIPTSFIEKNGVSPNTGQIVCSNHWLKPATEWHDMLGGHESTLLELITKLGSSHGVLGYAGV